MPVGRSVEEALMPEGIEQGEERRLIDDLRREDIYEEEKEEEEDGAEGSSGSGVQGKG